MMLVSALGFESTFVFEGKFSVTTSRLRRGAGGFGPRLGFSARLIGDRTIAGVSKCVPVNPFVEP